MGLAYIQKMSYVYKTNVKYDKNQKNNLHFLWKTRVKASKKS